MRFRMPWDDPFIQAILQAFKGRIVDIQAEKEPEPQAEDDGPPW